MNAQFKTERAAVEWIKKHGGHIVANNNQNGMPTVTCNCGDIFAYIYIDKEDNEQLASVCMFCGEIGDIETEDMVYLAHMSEEEVLKHRDGPDAILVEGEDWHNVRGTVVSEPSAVTKLKEVAK